MPSLSFAELPRPAKQTIFYGALALLYIAYGLIVVTYYTGNGQLSEWVMEQVAAYIPVAEKEISVPGALVPIVLGGLMAWTAPGRLAWLEFFAILALSAIAWLMYLHLQVFFAQPFVADLLPYGTVRADKVQDTVATLSGFANSIRSFVAVVFAAALGLRLNSNNGLMVTPPQPAAQVQPVAPVGPVAVTPPADSGA